ncbi:unnamed protein product, partial [Ceratitis capitata]
VLGQTSDELGKSVSFCETVQSFVRNNQEDCVMSSGSENRHHGATSTCSWLRSQQGSSMRDCNHRYA